MSKVRRIKLSISPAVLRNNPMTLMGKDTFLEQVGMFLPQDTTLVDIEAAPLASINFVLESKYFIECELDKVPSLITIINIDTTKESGIVVKEIKDLDQYLDVLPVGTVNTALKSDKNSEEEDEETKQKNKLKNFFFPKKEGSKCNCGVDYLRTGGKHDEGCPAKGWS